MKTTEIRIMVGVTCDNMEAAELLAQQIASILRNNVGPKFELIVKQVEIEHATRETKTIKA